MVADTESSDSAVGGANAAAAEKPVDGSPNKKSQEKVPKKIHKAEREKLKRDQLNDLFLELGSMLDLDRQNSGKATVLGDTARVLRDLVTQVESLRKEHAALLSECQYVTSEKNELLDENTTLQAEISELQNELRARMGSNNPDLSALAISQPLWSNNHNLSTLAVSHPMNTISPMQHQQQHPTDIGRVYMPPPQELQLFPEASTSPERESSRHTGSSRTISASLTDSLPGQLRLSLPRTAQDECSSRVASSSRKELKKG